MMARARPLWSMVLVTLVATVLLGACGKLPKPFRRPDAPPDALIRAKGGIGVRVALPEGTTDPMAKLIAASVVKSLSRREIPAVVGLEGRLRYALYGKVTPGNQGGAPRLQWRLVDDRPDGGATKKGETFFTFDSQVESTRADWEWGSPKLLDGIGAETGRLLAEAIAPEDKTLAASQPVARGIWVRPIAGAPGDGDVSLTRAMRYALIGAKVAVTSEPNAARHHLQGQVVLGAAKNEKQPVEIRWTVTFPDGGIVGHAVQRNVVPAGTFDGRWGESASIIAAAAIDGVKDVLDRAEETMRVRVSGKGNRIPRDAPYATDQIQLPPPDLAPAPANGAKK